MARRTCDSLIARVESLQHYPVASDDESSLPEDRRVQVVRLESCLGFRLPGGYRDFLLGLSILPYGVLARCGSGENRISMGIFYAPSSGGTNILESTSELPAKLRGSHVVFGELYTGESLCLKVSKGADGGVAVLRESGSLCEVARSFRDFVEGFHGESRVVRSERELRSAGLIVDYVGQDLDAPRSKGKKAATRPRKREKKGR